MKKEVTDIAKIHGHNLYLDEKSATDHYNLVLVPENLKKLKEAQEERRIKNMTEDEEQLRAEQAAKVAKRTEKLARVAPSEIAKLQEISRGNFLNWMIVKVVEAHLVSAEAVTNQFWRDNNDAEDPSGNEQISIEELSVGLNKCLGSDPKNAMSYAEVSALILELDVNDDGEFDKEEFESWLRRHSAPIAIQGSDFIPFKSCFKSLGKCCCRGSSDYSNI
jgi:hypothetical protein